MRVMLQRIVMIGVIIWSVRTNIAQTHSHLPLGGALLQERLWGLLRILHSLTQRLSASLTLKQLLGPYHTPMHPLHSSQLRGWTCMMNHVRVFRSVKLRLAVHNQGTLEQKPPSTQQTWLSLVRGYHPPTHNMLSTSVMTQNQSCTSSCASHLGTCLMLSPIQPACNSDSIGMRCRLVTHSMIRVLSRLLSV